MVAISHALGVVVAVLASTVSATAVHSDWTCIVVNGKPHCGWNWYHTKPVHIYGDVEIFACIDKYTGMSTCAYRGQVPKGWKTAHWKTDNCLYGAGFKPWAPQVGCAVTIEPKNVVNPYAG